MAPTVQIPNGPEHAGSFVRILWRRVDEEGVTRTIAIYVDEDLACYFGGQRQWSIPRGIA